MRTVVEILCDAVDSHGDRVAFQTYSPRGGVKSLTRHEVADRAASLAGMLHGRGIGPGSRVGLLACNGPEWGVAYFGVLLAGATLVPLDAKLKDAEIANILRRSGAVLLLTCAANADKARAAACGTCGVAALHDVPAADAAAAGGEGLDRLLERHRPAADDLAVISFTSGTTGEPKGIMLTHGNIASNVLIAPSVMDFGPDDNFLSVLPLNHLFEQTLGMVVPFRGGARVTYPQSLNPRVLVEAMRKTGATVAVIVPAVARLFHKRIEAEIAQLSPVKRAIVRAARRVAAASDAVGLPLGPVLLKGIRKGFGGEMRVFFSGGAALDDGTARLFKHIGLPIMQGYGLSETSPLVSVNTPARSRIGSVGKPIDGVRVKIDPVDGCDDGAGEILISGPNVMAGYFEDAAAAREALAGGWFRTGDIGRLDADGFLYITGRSKDVIIGESGKNVYPNEIEAEIARRPGVGDVCVLGLPADGPTRRHEQIVALVIPSGQCGRMDRDVIVETIRRELRVVRNTLASYKRPDYFMIWEDEFPRTATLKVKKRELVKLIDRESLLTL